MESMRLPWKSAFARAAAAEGVLTLTLIVIEFGAIPGFVGADNPLGLYLAGILQFPASVLFLATLSLNKSGFGMYLGIIGVAVLEFFVLALLFRYVWRGRGPKRSDTPEVAER